MDLRVFLLEPYTKGDQATNVIIFHGMSMIGFSLL